MFTGPWRLLLALAASLAVGAVASCARQGSPPGGPEDRRPPVVVATVPDTFAVLAEPFRGPVEFVFDERVSERVSGGTLDQAVVVSPRTGEVRVRHGRQSIAVELEGGFRPGLVYRVTLLPVIRDLFNNQLLAPFDLVFSTGGEYNPSAVAGRIWDRTTGEGVDALQVVALDTARADSVAHVARTDTSGVYVFRYLPQGGYRVLAFQDRNRNGRADPMELQGSGSFHVAGADTLLVDLPVLQPDTTAPRLTRAQVLDSLTVLLDFDDHLDPLSRSDLFGVRLTHDSTGTLVRTDVFHERDYRAWRQQLQDSLNRVDSLAAAQRAEDALEDIPLSRDTLAGDTLARRPAPPPTPTPAPARAAAPRPLPPMLPPATGGGRTGALASGPEVLAPDGRPLPSRRVVLRVSEPLVVNAPYTVTADAVVNINGLSGPAGNAAVIRQPPPDTAAADSLSADSLSAPPDTALARPDTASTRPDSVAPPDTGRALPGRGGVVYLPGRRW